jgi:hypothetical protein
MPSTNPHDADTVVQVLIPKHQKAELPYLELKTPIAGRVYNGIVPAPKLLNAGELQTLTCRAI